MSEKILVSEHFPQPGQTWIQNPYKLATEMCRWVNHMRLGPEDVVSIQIFPDKIVDPTAVGGVIFYWS